MILKMLKRGGQLLLIPVITGTVVLALMAVAFLFPTGEMKAHVRNEMEMFDQKDIYFNLTGEPGELHDNHVEAEYLNMALVSVKDADLLSCVLSGYHYIQADPAKVVDNLNAAVTDPESVTVLDVYKRFFNGQIIYLKPLLRLTGYSGIRTLCLYSCLLGTVLLGFMMYRRGLGVYIAPVMLSVQFICPLAAWMSMAFSGIYMCMLIPCLAMLKMKKETLKKRGWLIFGITGSITFCINVNYFQLITFGVPALMYLLLAGLPEKPAELLKTILDFFAAWMIGYAGAMVFKWGVYSAAMGKNIFGDMISHALWRSGEEEGSRVQTVLTNARIGFGNFWWILTEAAFIGWTLVRWKKERVKVSYSAAEILLLLVMILFPVCRFAVLANHSMLHSYFVYRILMIPVLAFNLLLAGKRRGQTVPGGITT